MFERIVLAFGDGLRHLLLDHPLVPGVGGTHPPVPPTTTTERGDESPILRYLPLLALLAIFWPVLLTLVAASVSASAWLFWLCVGSAFGVLQLAYVLYNFAMIVWDVSALTLLKTFAMLRSIARHYYYKFGGGSSLRGGRERHGASNRRRKEWREEVDGASSYEEYCRIELLEPGRRPGDDDRAADRPQVDANMPPRRTTYAASPASIPEKSPFGLRLRKRIAPSSPPTGGGDVADSHPPGSPIRKIQSSRDFNEGTPSSTPSSRVGPSLRRVSSGAPLLGRSGADGIDALNRDAEWRRVVREDLGMTGEMMIATLARLREARAQASSMNNNDDRIGDASSGGDGNDQQWGEDHSSSLKTLLSGIVKRNHLSVDDFLMEDARSVAERGQHSLMRETRDTIDGYGEEVERCIEWVASGTVHLGGGGGGGSGDLPSSEPARRTGDDGNNGRAGNVTPEQIMQRQRDELSKRYTLFKRMKQNMGHTALMLSGGGAQAMYHLGTIKALVESALYEHIHVISGTSGGR